MLLLVLVGLSACARRESWIEFRGKNGRGRTANTFNPPVAVKWKLDLQEGPSRDRAFNTPILVDNTLFFGSTDGNFYAMDIESGYMRWVYKTGGPINSVPFADDNNVYFGSNDGNAYALDRKEGTLLWSFETDRTVQSSFAGFDGNVVFTSDAGSTYFVSPEGVEEFHIPNPVWHYHTFQIFKDVMYFAPGPEHTPLSLGAYDLNQRAYLWLIDTLNDNATWYSFPAVEERLLYYSTAGQAGEVWNYEYIALNRETGLPVWKEYDESLHGPHLPRSPRTMFRANLNLLDYMAPALWKDLVIFTSGDSVVRAFKKSTGRIVWRKPFEHPTSSAPIIAGDRIYFGIYGDREDLGTAPPRLICLSARDGRLLWDVELEGAVMSAPVIAGDWIVFGTDQNVFYILQEVY